MTPPPGGGNGAGPSQDDQQQRQSWHESPTKAYTYSNRPLVTPGRSPSPAPSKLQALLEFVSGDVQQSQSHSSTAFDSPTPANRPGLRQRPRRPASTNPGSNTPTRTMTTMGFSSLPRIHTRLWCKLRNRTFNLNRLRRTRRTYSSCKRRSIERMRSRVRLRRGR